MTFCAIDPLSFPFQVLPIADAPRFLSRLDFGMLEGFSLRTFHRKACQDNFSDTKADGRRVADQAFVQGHFCQGPRSCVLQAAVSASFCPFPERGFWVRARALRLVDWDLNSSSRVSFGINLEAWHDLAMLQLPQPPNLITAHPPPSVLLMGWMVVIEDNLTASTMCRAQQIC